MLALLIRQTRTLRAVSRNTNHPTFVQLRSESDRRFSAFKGGGQGEFDTEEISSRFNLNSSGRIVLYTDRPPALHVADNVTQTFWLR